MSASFKRKVWDHYRTHGRHDLPWRQTRDPYNILVSEVMLQQTQVARVIPFYKNFLEQFPTVTALARAPLSAVLRAWQGLGYNRRAKLLRAAAQWVVKDHNGRFPRAIETLEELPGVGPYTARAVAALAFNVDCVLLETNIRTAILHHFFSGSAGMSSSQSAPAARPILLFAKNMPAPQKISDAQIQEILVTLLPKGKSREWNLALMDYGAHLKQQGIKLNANSKHYVRQSKFAGSNREARGAILKELTRGARSTPRLLGLLGDDRKTQLQSALSALLSEQLIQKRGRAFALPR